nr:ADP-ribosylation factor GTPase-activating protein AGD3-like [Arachis hypogaea]
MDNNGYTRERFLSLRKGTKSEVANALEEELHNAKSTFEQARFNLVTALSNVEAKKRLEFLEAVSGTMDAHLRYFKQVDIVFVYVSSAPYSLSPCLS